MRTFEARPLSYPEFGVRLRAIREEQRISLRRLARQAGISKAALSAYERGEQVPGLGPAERIAAALGHSLPHLLNQIEERSQ